MNRTLGWILIVLTTLLAPFSWVAEGVVLCIAQGQFGHIAIEVGACPDGNGESKSPLESGQPELNQHSECVPCIDLLVSTHEPLNPVRIVDAGPAVPPALESRALHVDSLSPSHFKRRRTQLPHSSPRAPLVLRI